MDTSSFSRRHGFEAPDPEITVRNDAPRDLRQMVVAIAYESGLEPGALRSLVCGVLLEPEDENNWSAYPNIDGELKSHLRDCEWYEVYDVIEAIHTRLLKAKKTRSAEDAAANANRFAEKLNKYFRRRGIGWQLIEGQLHVRGPEAFEAALTETTGTLRASDRSTAANEIHQALMDLSKRPHQDLTGALQHALAALECVARDVTGEPSATLGAILGRHKTLLPPPMDKAAEKLWGFASEQGRHLREGRVPDAEEVELAVHVAAALATYLDRRVLRDVH